MRSCVVLLAAVLLQVGICAGQHVQVVEVGSGGLDLDEEIYLNWTGDHLYYSKLAGVKRFASNPEVRVVDTKTGAEIAKKVFKDMGKDCEPHVVSSFRITFVGAHEFVAQHCSALYLLDADNLSIKKRVYDREIDEVEWSEPAKVLVLRRRGIARDKVPDSVVVIDGNKWEQIAEWPLSSDSGAFDRIETSRDGSLLATQENAGNFSIKRLPAGEPQGKYSAPDYNSPVRLLDGGKGPTLAFIQHRDAGVSVTLWDLERSQKANEFVLEDSRNVSVDDYSLGLTASPAWKWIIGGQQGHPQQFLVWDANTGRISARVAAAKLEKVRTDSTYGPPTMSFEVSGDGNSVLAKTYWHMRGSAFSVLRISP